MCFYFYDAAYLTTFKHFEKMNDSEAFLKFYIDEDSVFIVVKANEDVIELLELLLSGFEASENCNGGSLES